MWSHKYDRTADFIVIEGPKAGGHLGFSNEQLNNTASLDFDNEITNIIECKKNMKINTPKNTCYCCRWNIR